MYNLTTQIINEIRLRSLSSHHCLDTAVAGTVATVVRTAVVDRTVAASDTAASVRKRRPAAMVPTKMAHRIAVVYRRRRSFVGYNSVVRSASGVSCREESKSYHLLVELPLLNRPCKFQLAA